MQYDDAIYGPCAITAPVLLDLLNARAVRRLRGVLQHGISGLLGHTRAITRYEHSVGTMLLVQRLGGRLEEQVAALLHDVSHTAFSHVIDFVFDDHGTQSYHERMKRWWVAQTDVPEVLRRHGLDWEDFLSDEPFPLLEQPSPSLCADRLDYFLRDATALGVLSATDARSVCDHLVVAHGHVAVSDVQTARLIGDRYMQADEASWSNPAEAVLYELTARAIRVALSRGAIADADLWGTDAELWGSLGRSDDPVVAEAVARVTRPYTLVKCDAAPTLRLRPKVRTVDPDVVCAGGVRRLSELDPAFARCRREYLRRKSDGIAVRLVEAAHPKSSVR